MFGRKEQQDIKDLILKNLAYAGYPPTYEQDLAFYQENMGFNCYAYAMQLQILSQEIDNLNFSSKPYYIYNVGTLSSRRIKIPKYEKEDIFSYFQGDCSFLGINYDITSIDSPALPNTYKIAIFTQLMNDFDGFDFHFVRQNADLSWSQIPCVDGCPELIDINSDLKDFEFINCVRVRKPNL